MGQMGKLTAGEGPAQVHTAGHGTQSPTCWSAGQQGAPKAFTKLPQTHWTKMPPRV